MTGRIAAAAAAVALAAAAAGCSGEDGGNAAGSGGLEDGFAALPRSPESFAAGAAASTGGGITVVGTGTATVTPDTAEWSFTVQSSAGTADAALVANSEAMERVLDALAGAGVAKGDLRTEQVGLSPRTSDDGITIVGYVAANTVRATIEDLAAAGRVVDAAVAAGANRVSGPSLTASAAAEQHRAAVEAAFADARARAEAIAGNAGLTLGDPVAIVESGGGGMPFLRADVAEAAAVDVPIEPGVQDVVASLTVTFAIA